ncbi:hypothetical protein EYF80_052379 [Liparis tanakae]|uniref:Uncharacterized protein n=1 Tax=Liparis tanakae TaxID=230148 RepID=A0A4Z2F909_9TELE|nr:hypothetical protein EYF80_052379 [Liparis tanakae]
MELLFNRVRKMKGLGEKEELSVFFLQPPPNNIGTPSSRVLNWRTSPAPARFLGGPRCTTQLFSRQPAGLLSVPRRTARVEVGSSKHNKTTCSLTPEIKDMEINQLLTDRVMSY